MATGEPKLGKKLKGPEKAQPKAQQDKWEKCHVINIQKRNSNTVCVAITKGHCVKCGCETSLMPSDCLRRAVGAHSHVSCLPGICTWDVNESLTESGWLHMYNQGLHIIFIRSDTTCQESKTLKRQYFVFSALLSNYDSDFGRERKE